MADITPLPEAEYLDMVDQLSEQAAFQVGIFEPQSRDREAYRIMVYNVYHEGYANGNEGSADHVLNITNMLKRAAYQLARSRDERLTSFEQMRCRGQLDAYAETFEDVGLTDTRAAFLTALGAATKKHPVPDERSWDASNVEWGKALVLEFGRVITR